MLVVLAAVAALAAGGKHVWNRSNPRAGADYYFPAWRIPAVVSEAEANRRFRLVEAMGPEQACPILIEGAARPKWVVGTLWGEFLEKLPVLLADPLPRYEWYGDVLLRWLASDSKHPKVAEAVAREWPHWDDGRRFVFLVGIPRSRRSVEPALVPVLLSAMSHPDGVGGDLAAAAVVAGLTNRPPDLDVALSTIPDLDGSTLQQLAGTGVLSDRLESALVAGPASKDPAVRFWYAMTLARCLPERHPPERVLGDLLDVEHFRVRWGETERFLVRRGVFEPVVSTPFFRRRCLAILSGPEADAAVRERVLQVLARVASPDDETALGLRPSLTARESDLFPVAMRAFLASASPRTENVVLVASGLAHKRTCAATLLWLTEAGTNAMPLASAVEAMAHDVFPAGMQEGSADRMQLPREDAVRYGLLSSASSPRRPGSLGPSTVLAQPNADIPVRLLATWPKREVLDGGGTRRTRMVPEIPLNSLAERCLRSMRGEPLE